MASHQHISYENQSSSQQLGSDLLETADNQQQENQSPAYEKPKTRGRGATRMTRVWVRRTRKEVHFNKLGQPIGPNKGELVEFLGTIVRNGSLAPLDTKSWHKVPQSLKRAMIDVLKAKFVVHPGFDSWALKSLAKKWRSWKNRVKKKYFDPKASLEENLRRRPDSDDERVLPYQWKNLVKFWDTMEARRQSAKNKEYRAQKKKDHHNGKKSIAQVADEMKNIAMAEKEKDGESDDERDDVMDDDPTDYEESGDGRDDVIDDNLTDYEASRVDLFGKCDAQNENTYNPVVSEPLRTMKKVRSNMPQSFQDKGPNDIFSRVNQVEGDTPSDIHDTMPSRASCHRMEYKQEIEKLKRQILEQDKQLNELKLINMQRDRNDSPLQVPAAPSSSHTQFSASNGRPTSTISSMPLTVGATISLKSLFDPPKVVAIGRIESLEPSTQVGQIKLGKNWCEVKITIALEVDEELIRPVYECTTIGEVVGKSIAWPLHLVAMVKVW